DERHGRWMLQDVALPLARMYAGNARELIIGYDQQRFISERAGKATAEAVRQADFRNNHVSIVNFEKSFEAAA
ncbi:MAG: hypothetical protein LC775_18930, partial [Acidobacteria bacterium]|nr:hypothetical protein [Acidobacteriota bacterium]